MPRVTAKEVETLKLVYYIKINDDVDTKLPKIFNDEYNNNMNDQASTHCFMKLKSSFEFLKTSLGCTLSNLPRHVWSSGYDENNSDGENTMNEMIRLILTDFYANCNKPSSSLINERTPYIDYVVPVFKYFCATTKLMSFLWCEKGLSSTKLLAICMPDNSTKKLLDGIGTTLVGDLERVLVESSGETDSKHTIEDTVKLMECAAKCLREEMSQNPQASYLSFLKRRVYCVQYVNNKLSLMSVQIASKDKWICISERSAIIPRTYEQRQHWLAVFELLAKLKESLEVQDALTKKILDQQTGWEQIEAKDRVRNIIK